jgi:hypothetical protein
VYKCLSQIPLTWLHIKSRFPVSLLTLYYVRVETELLKIALLSQSEDNVPESSFESEETDGCEVVPNILGMLNLHL